MRCRNLAKATRTIISNGNFFPGTIDGRTYTATEDNQLLRLWGNIVLPNTEDGMVTAIMENISGEVGATKNVIFTDGLAYTEGANLWNKGLIMSAGAKVTLRCRAKISDSDWRIMQSLGVCCFDKDTAPY